MQNRVLVRLTAVAGIVALGTAMAAFQNVVPPAYAWSGLALFFACLLGIAAMAWRARTDLLARREDIARGQAIVMLAAQLRNEEAATLEQLVRRGGPSGEAAALILEGRAERARRRPDPGA